MMQEAAPEVSCRTPVAIAAQYTTALAAGMRTRRRPAVLASQVAELPQWP